MATSLVIRNLPEDVIETLRRQADDNGQSLQAYMADVATRLAQRPTPRQWSLGVARMQERWRENGLSIPSRSAILAALAEPR